MKKVLTMILSIMCLLFANTTTVNAQQRTKIQDGLYIVDYGGKYVIEDNINQRSISITIAQQRIDIQNNEEMYQVVCGSFSKVVTKFALKTAVKEGIRQAGATGGTSLFVSLAGDIASWLYDKSCAYWERKNKEMRNGYGR